MGNFIVQSMTQTLSNFYEMVARFLPHLLAMLIIIVLGLIVAFVLKLVVGGGLRLARFRELCDRSGLNQLMQKLALPAPDELIAQLVFWVVWVAFILLGVDALGIAALHEQISRFIQFLPQIFVALLVLFVGLLAANFFSRATLLAAANANYASARLLASLVRFLIAILAVTMALEQLGLGRHAVLIAFSIAFGAIMLGLAIAFGLGGRDLARSILEREFIEKKREEEEDEASPL
jgi:Mechanosensitive ion channel, conserved TM helix